MRLFIAEKPDLAKAIVDVFCKAPIGPDKFGN